MRVCVYVFTVKDTTPTHLEDINGRGVDTINYICCITVTVSLDKFPQPTPKYILRRVSIVI